MKTHAEAGLLAKIAQMTHTPIYDVEMAYEAACDDLRKDAKSQDYIPLFAAKRVTAHFRKAAVR